MGVGSGGTGPSWRKDFSGLSGLHTHNVGVNNSVVSTGSENRRGLVN